MSVDPAIAGYMEGFYQFLEDSKADPLSLEQMVYCAEPEYAGTYDAEMAMSMGTVLIDFKSGQPREKDAMQVALYAWAKYRADTPLALLYLKPKNKRRKYDFRPLSMEEAIRARDDGLAAVRKYYAMTDDIFGGVT